MGSNLSSIGLDVASEAEFNKIVSPLADMAEYRAGCPDGFYAVWRSQTGAELWFHVVSSPGGALDFKGLTPFFEGKSAVKVGLQNRIRGHRCNVFEGAFGGHVYVPGQDAENWSYPFIFDAVDFAAHSRVELPAMRQARLSGFTRNLKAFASAKAFSATQAEEHGFAAQGFIPTGTFDPNESEDGGSNFEPSSAAYLTGTVLEHKRHTNEVTGRDFHWLLVESYAATYDLVTDLKSVTGEIVTGGTVEAECAFFGRILD